MLNRAPAVTALDKEMWRKILSRCSLEVPVSRAADFVPAHDVFQKGSFVFLPHISDLDSRGMENASRHLVDSGYVPVPHVGARHFASESAFLSHLRGAREGGARHLLVLSGDRDAPAGPFTSALNILAHGAIKDFGFQRVFISGYPEGHQRISNDALERATRSKIEVMQDSGVNVSIVTQFGFASSAYRIWLHRIRQNGIRCPIRLGLAGVTSIPSLLKYAALCGIGPSLSVLRKRSGAIAGLVKGYEPSGLIAELNRELDIANHDQLNLHLFPFGGAAKTIEWFRTRIGAPNA
ncbi:methylenetetrahydrofolate reductase [Aminobacter ciceronei]|uniref:Methylenetetrahydrofolate reductase n=1 Tax=Aminobacter ciceronei TaxID=150723 RepID=A0ABR6C8L5_9HYPH|nr:methylenetetrahydrofolate reductase [Aminobacter ciceronei]MBA8907540.1 methylenetetrahydrofolate reductase (NADPH) [Aminobacter ciceronei]MBA9021359.1 methylenetetrahydrofolate reductase (NADPH) [Aminobacter ciceronei]